MLPKIYSIYDKRIINSEDANLIKKLVVRELISTGQKAIAKMLHNAKISVSYAIADRSLWRYDMEMMTYNEDNYPILIENKSYIACLLDDFTPANKIRPYQFDIVLDGSEKELFEWIYGEEDMDEYYQLN